MIVTALTSAALACGGVFCDAGPTSSDPLVVQTGEEIVFEVRDGMVEMEVSIFYEGPPEDFGWVVPVSGLPDLEVGTRNFLDLRTLTSPIYSLQTDVDGLCGGGGLGCAESSILMRGDEAWDSGWDEDVVVVDQEEVGPYDTVTLQASSSTALEEWLVEAGFAIPDNFAEAVAPYVAEGQYFVALKLRGEVGVDRIEPIKLTFPGERASIPLRLTAVAASEDLLIDVYMIGESRAVPENYLHATVNDAALDWFGDVPGSNHFDVLSRAVDEAGGQAFVTTAAVDYINGRTLTRLTTMISPEEMTADPVFVFNSDIDQRVDPVKLATLTVDCTGPHSSATAPRTLELPDGRRVNLPSNRQLSRRGETQAEVLASIGDPAAILIEDYSASGQPEILFDYRLEGEREAFLLRRQGCGGCTASDPRLSLLLVAFLGPLMLRRRH